MARGNSSADEGTLSQKLLAVALIEFGEKGFEGARVDEMAKAAGASKQVLYHHFGSKEGLFAACVDEAYRRLRAPDEKIKERLKKLEPEDALREFVEHLFKPSLGTIQFQRIIHDENRFKAAHSRDLSHAKRAYAELIQTLGDILQRGHVAGVFRPGVDPRQFYVFIAGVLVYRLTNAYTLSALLGLALDTQEGARKSRAYAIDLVLDALRPHAAPRAATSNRKLRAVPAVRKSLAT